jgi:hypothetical protein
MEFDLYWKITIRLRLKALVYPKGLEPLISTFVRLCLDPFGYGYKFASISCSSKCLIDGFDLFRIVVYLRLKAVVGAEGFEPPCRNDA